MQQAPTWLAQGRAEAVQQLLAWPRTVRGYGHVRARHAEAALKQREAALAALAKPVANAATAQTAPVA